VIIGVDRVVLIIGRADDTEGVLSAGNCQDQVPAVAAEGFVHRGSQSGPVVGHAEVWFLADAANSGDVFGINFAATSIFDLQINRASAGIEQGKVFDAPVAVEVRANHRPDLLGHGGNRKHEKVQHEGWNKTAIHSRLYDMDAKLLLQQQRRQTNRSAALI